MFNVCLGYKIANQKAAKKPNKKKTKSAYEKEVAVLTAERHMYSAYYQVKVNYCFESKLNVFINSRV